MADMTKEEKEHVMSLQSNIELRKVEIKYKEWKIAFEKLAHWIRNNFGDTTLFDVTTKINEFRPDK